MPYRTVSDARESIPALQSYNDEEVKQFIAVFNKLTSEGKKEGEAIPEAIGSIKKADAKSTPAKPSERRSGSKRNSEGSAKTGAKVTFSEKVTQSLKNKVKEHNKDNPKNKVTLAQLKAVYRRGAGAFSTSHHPNATRGSWAMGRVNSFLRGGHSQDDDLRKAEDYDIEKEEEIQNFLDILDKAHHSDYEDDDIEKGTTDQVKTDKNGNKIYRGIKFRGYNVPRRSDNPKKDRMVLAKKGNQVKIVRYGDASMRQNYSNEANDRFYDRFGSRPQANDKFSATYWSLRDLWPRGSLKGKGAKPLKPLKKGYDTEMNKDKLDLIKLMFGWLTSGDKDESYEEDDDLMTSYDEEEAINAAWTYNDEYQEKSNTIELVKQLSDDEMVAIEPLYINAGEADLHGDGITDVELDKLIDNFNKNIDNISGNIHHKVDTEAFKPVKAYRMPMDVYIGDPDKPSEMKLIREGQPVVKVKFAETEEGLSLWNKRKEGILRGVSIGAKGKRVPNPDYEGE